MLTAVCHSPHVTRTIAATQYLIAALIGLYLGAGQHIAHTSSTIAVALVATIAARRSTARAAHVGEVARVSARRAEPVQSVAVTRVAEHDLDRHVDLDLVGFTLDDVRHHAGTLV